MHFLGETDDDLLALSQKFIDQAYQRWQEMLLKHLFEPGYLPTSILGLRLSELLSLALDRQGTALRTLYLFVWRKIHPDGGEDAFAFTTSEGTPIDPLDLKDYLRKSAAPDETPPLMVISAEACWPSDTWVR
jgi:hypothetical protein